MGNTLQKNRQPDEEVWLWMGVCKSALQELIILVILEVRMTKLSTVNVLIFSFNQRIIPCQINTSFPILFKICNYDCNLQML